VVARARRVAPLVLIAALPPPAENSFPPSNWQQISSAELIRRGRSPAGFGRVEQDAGRQERGAHRPPSIERYFLFTRGGHQRNGTVGVDSPGKRFVPTAFNSGKEKKITRNEQLTHSTASVVFQGFKFEMHLRYDD
jgi:hypothetical protein